MSTPEPASAEHLLTRLVDILATGTVSALQFERLASELQLERGEPTIMLLTGIKQILRELPDKAFTDRNARLTMVDAVQDALDVEIDAEEERAEQEQHAEDSRGP